MFIGFKGIAGVPIVSIVVPFRGLTKSVLYRDP